MRPRPLTPEHDELAQAWRAVALQKMPYMAATLFSLRFVDAPGLGTFAVDRHHRCYIDFAAVEPEGPTSCGESLLHECMHLLGRDSDFAADLGIAGGPLAKAWNVATDAAHNDDLRDAGCATFDDAGPFVLPCKLGMVDYQTAQTYFAHLRKAIDKKRAKQGSGRPRPVQAQDAGSSVPEPQSPYKGCGSGSGGDGAPCELDEGDDLGGAAPAASDAEKVRIQITTAIAIKDAAAKGRGTVPGGLVEYATLVLAPAKVPWQKVIGRTLRGAVRSRLGGADQSFTRRNARRHNDRILTPNGRGRRLVAPATVTPIPTIHFIRDTSGSVGPEDLNAITSEVVGIAKQLGIRGDDLVITDVDAAVHGSKKFGQVRDLNTVEGRGGTDMCVGIEHAIALKPRPTAIVVGTDGGTPWPAVQTSRIPVIALIVARNAEAIAEHVPSWIRTVCVDPLDASHNRTPAPAGTEGRR